MRHGFRVVWGAALVGALMAPPAHAQLRYPGGYGGYGWGGWGADPASGYMAGLGSFARGQGAYEVEDAQARAINLDTMLKWNQALRDRQKDLRREQREEEARRRAETEERARRLDLQDGTTLNDLLMQIYDLDPGVAKSTRAKAPLSADAIREIPFEWDTEAITFCIDQMTGRDSLPPPLMDAKFSKEREALRKAVEAAIAEDAHGDVRPTTRRRLLDAISALRAKFAGAVPEYDPGYLDADEFLTTLSSLSRLVNDPSMGKALAQLENFRDASVGDLLAFMHLYNLRFGQATSDRQIRIYRSLVPLLTEIRDGGDPAPAARAADDRSDRRLRDAARGAFKGMTWKQLQAHDHDD